MQARYIFISGGDRGIQNEIGTVISCPFLNDVERYDSLKNIWESMPKLNFLRKNHSSCTVGNNLYILGGSIKVSQN